MKKFLIIFFSIVLLILPTVYAEDFDTNIVGGTTGGDYSGGEGADRRWKYWARFDVTGTRYVIRVYDWNSGQYIAVPKEYYINHIYKTKNDGTVNTTKEFMYLGVNKVNSTNAEHDWVRSSVNSKGIFQDTTYSHVIKWFDNNKVKNFGVTKNDVDLLAGIVQEAAIKNGDTDIIEKMQNIIDGTVAYDIRAEILFLLKPHNSESKQIKRSNIKVPGKGSIENYKFSYFEHRGTSNDKTTWIKDYFTYNEFKSATYTISQASNGYNMGLVDKLDWMDKIACALFEKDEEYVFANGVYQCSCDLYKRAGGTWGLKYETELWSTNKIFYLTMNKPSSNGGNRMFRYYPPGRCGIPVEWKGETLYVTGGKTYNYKVKAGGKKVTLQVYQRVKYSDGVTTESWTNYGNYLPVVTNDPHKAIIYEGWDYITNKLAATLVIAVDKETGNIIETNDIAYSKFENVGQGVYPKTAWDIDGYKYVGYITKNDFSAPSMPIMVENTGKDTSINITAEDVSKGAKKQVIFVYEKDENEESSNEARVSIYEIKDEYNNMMFTGRCLIDLENKKLTLKIYNKAGDLKYLNEMTYDETTGYIINSNNLEESLGIDMTQYEYIGNIIKTNPDVFLAYLGEDLNPKSGDIYNLKDIGNDKVHIILGYMPTITPPPDPNEEEPEIKVSYVDEQGNLLPDNPPVITKELVDVDIVKEALDLRDKMYMYRGYTYEDSVDTFVDVENPPELKGTEDNVETRFSVGNQRRHIVFVYKKIELKFEIDIEMKVNDLENQYIDQKDNEDYWVLDREGKVVLKVNATGTEGLNVLGYTIKLKLPFDTYMNGNFIPAGTTNNLNVNDLSEIVIADRLIVPIWVDEKEYNIDVMIEANVEGFGIVSARKSDNVEIIGRLYDFTVTNIDGSDRTGDIEWNKSLFESEETEYKANSIPVGQSNNQPDKYNYGIKLGTAFFFSVNTKGLKNDAISIIPKFLYVSEDGKTIKDVDIYVNNAGKMYNILSDVLPKRNMRLRDPYILKTAVMNEIRRAKDIERYKYDAATSRSIGSYSHILLSKYLSLPYANYIEEFKALYGPNAMNQAGKTENGLLTYATHWYGKYVIPASAKIVDSGANASSEGYEDGYLIVLFKIISLDSDGKGYLSYELPKSKTQWQRENLNQLINLPKINKNDGGKQIVIDSLKDGYAPVIIYQVGATTLDNNTSAGTH